MSILTGTLFSLKRKWERKKLGAHRECYSQGKLLVSLLSVYTKTNISVCVSSQSYGVQEYLSVETDMEVLQFHASIAGSALRIAKVIPASHFALHLVFIFQAIKPASKRWKMCECVRKSINVLPQIECAWKVLTYTLLWVCRCRLNGIKESRRTKVFVHCVWERVCVLMNSLTRVHRATGLIRSEECARTGQGPADPAPSAQPAE